MALVKKGKLELTWVGKDDRTRLEPRVLVEDSSKSYGNQDSDNMLIYGDNLLALKALEQDFAGMIKCAFIDPPYNTGSAFEQYDDGLEHSLWLQMMRPRIQMIRSLLCNSGSLWITIDDNECHYLKILCDEIFGRLNFVATCVWEKDKGGRGDADISLSHDNILVYAKDRGAWADVRNLLPRNETQLGRFRNPDNDPRGAWRQGDDGTAKSGTEKQRFEVTLPSGRVVRPPRGRFWAFSPETLENARTEGRAYFGADGDRLPIIKRYLSEVRDGVAPRTWWSADEVGTNQEAKRDHLRKLLPEIEPFATPKPEGLVARAISISTQPGDIVLDSFAGSGTTGATAHKMGRKWIMVELGQHCHTHIIPRMKKVIEGDDPYGVTDKYGWHGGGGFRYYRLAETLLVRDADLSTNHHPVYVINPRYDRKLLIRSICKIEGFRYRNEGRLHGISSENRFLHVTTQLLTQQYLDSLSADISETQSLLVYCTRSKRKLIVPDNIDIKKIPRDLLAKCDFEEDK